MQNRQLFRVVGIIIAAAGLILVSNPTLVTGVPLPEDTFEAIEGRVWWGLIIGLGVLLYYHNPTRPWRLNLIATGAACTFGLLMARLVGIVLDGSVPTQWFWVVVEAAILVGLFLLYRKLDR